MRKRKKFVRTNDCKYKSYIYDITQISLHVCCKCTFALREIVHVRQKFRETLKIDCGPTTRSRYSIPVCRLAGKGLHVVPSNIVEYEHPIDRSLFRPTVFRFSRRLSSRRRRDRERRFDDDWETSSRLTRQWILQHVC